MSEGTAAREKPATPTPQVDPAQLQYAVEQLRAQQNLLGGALAGLAAALLGAAIWAGITFATHFQIGWMAVGVGFLVGVAVRSFGRGIDKVFGIVGAAFSLLGCAVGNLLAVCGAVARQENMAFMDVLSSLDPGIVQELMVATFSPMDLLFYAIAIYEGYRLSFRQLSHEELRALIPG